MQNMSTFPICISSHTGSDCDANCAARQPSISLLRLSNLDYTRSDRQTDRQVTASAIRTNESANVTTPSNATLHIGVTWLISLCVCGGGGGGRRVGSGEKSTVGIRNSHACILRPVKRRFVNFLCLYITHITVLKIFLFLFAPIQLSSQKNILRYNKYWRGI
jgi:hypothetical protein